MKNNKEDKPTLFKELFYRNLKECANSLFYYNALNEKNKTITLPTDINHPIEYKINNYGYRGKNFLENKEILTLGCSHTFGVGIPEDFIWPQVFSKKINTEFHNLACPGDGLQGQVYKAFQYFKEFGHPKFIFGFFPYGRMELPYIPNVFGKKYNDGSADDGKEIAVIQRIIFEGNDIETYSKTPHNPVSVLPKELSIFYNFMFIQILEQYCKTNNIELIWTLYNSAGIIEPYFQTELPEILNNYISVSHINTYAPACHTSKINYNLNIKECHRELADHPLFNHASDCNHSRKQNGHFSIHFHQHIADTFYEAYLEKMAKTV